jgi:hypothetical protein
MRSRNAAISAGSSSRDERGGGLRVVDRTSVEQRLQRRFPPCQLPELTPFDAQQARVEQAEDRQVLGPQRGEGLAVEGDDELGVVDATVDDHPVVGGTDRHTRSITDDQAEPAPRTHRTGHLGRARGRLQLQ